MAQKVVVLKISDVSGKELGEDGQTLTFGWLGVDYSIDLSQEEADEFAKVMTPWVDVATRIGGRRQARTASSGTQRDPSQTAKIREWAKDNNFKVSSRGRIPQEVVDAYEEAHKA